jgi:hypothetical protein|tara:strand:+ start:2369 stop:3736 length:1368 start_codon:yes stop_codon:yes gene_type:complete
MVANGVISVTASIMESSDIGSSDNPEKPKESFFEKMKRWTAHIGKNWKGMVKKGATAGFYALLASSKIMQGVTKAMFGIVGSLIDILLAPLIPFISDGINWLADIVRAVGDFIKNMPEAFKKIWEPIWDYIYGVSRGAGDKILGIFEKKGAELNADGSSREGLVAKTIGSDKGPLVSDTEKDAFLDGTATDHAILIDEPITQEDIDEFQEDNIEAFADTLPTDAEVQEVHQSYVDGIEDALELPSEERITEVRDSYAAGFEAQFKLPTQEEVTAVQDSYIEAITIPEDKLEEAVYGSPTWMDDDPDAPANPPEGPINQFHVKTAVDAGEIVGLSDEDAEDFGKESMDKWYNSWINHVPEFNLEEMLTEFLPDDWDPVGAVTNLFSGGKSVEREAIAQELVNTVVHGPKAPPLSIFQRISPGGDSSTLTSSLGTIDPADRAFAEAMLLELYLLSKK